MISPAELESLQSLPIASADLFVSLSISSNEQNIWLRKSARLAWKKLHYDNKNLEAHIPLQENSPQPPAVEIGLSTSQELQVLHDPPLQIVNANGEMSSILQLNIDKHTANLEATILQAAACNANTQLGMGFSLDEFPAWGSHHEHFYSILLYEHLQARYQAQRLRHEEGLGSNCKC